MKAVAYKCIAALLTAALLFHPVLAAGKTFPDVPSEEWYYEPVMQASHLGLITGYPDGRFGPKDDVTRAQIVQILYNCYGSDKGTDSGFRDVDKNEWYAKAITWASKTGIVQGTGAKSFAPKDKLTREQMVSILYAKAGRPDVDANSVLGYYIDYKDVSSWAKNAMAWAVQNGIVTGTTDTTLSPGATASRAQSATIITRYLHTVDGVPLPEIGKS